MPFLFRRLAIVRRPKGRRISKAEIGLHCHPASLRFIPPLLLWFRACPNLGFARRLLACTGARHPKETSSLQAKKVCAMPVSRTPKPCSTDSSFLARPPARGEIGLHCHHASLRFIPPLLLWFRACPNLGFARRLLACTGARHPRETSSLQAKKVCAIVNRWSAGVKHSVK